MAGVDIKLDKQWSIFERLISPKRFRPALERNLAKATTRNGAIVQKVIRKSIRSGAFERNAGLTEMIKGRNRPLRHGDDLIKAIHRIKTDKFTSEVGVTKGNPLAGIAKTIHQGATIPVTPKMRALFSVLAGASDTGRNASSTELRGRAAELFALQPRGWKALSRSTTSIRIPARPFLEPVQEDASLKKKAAENWANATATAVAGKPFTAKN